MARILIIEDNAANLSLMSYLLSAVGHAPEGSRDGMSGLETARRTRPDLVLCDIQLPRCSGYEIARALRADEACRALPLVAVTAQAMRGDRERILAAGFDGYIEKPIAPESFSAQVEAHLPAPLRKGAGVPESSAPAAPVPAPAAMRLGTVLAVDDLPSNRRLVETILESAGYQVLTAGGMLEALEVMRRDTVDLVVSDVHMHPGNGFEFRRAAAADPALAGVPFVFLTSSVVRDDERRLAAELSVQRMLERPLDPALLIRAVDECLQAAGERAAPP